MNILIATTYIPFMPGGDIMLLNDLATELTMAGHQVDTVKIPLLSYWPRLAEETLAIRMLHLIEANGQKVDRLITLRYPSYALRHPDKITWFLHHHRAAYDLWGTEWSDMSNHPDGERVRNGMIHSDTYYLRECSRVYTISRNIAHRLKNFNDINADGILYPPLPRKHLFRCGDSGDYFLYVSRVCRIKRQYLAIEALQYCKSDIRLVIAGDPESPDYRDTLVELMRKCGVQERVQMIGWVSEKQKAELYAKCCGGLYLAYDEDTYGLSTLESLHSGKPLITLWDSGGSLEVIEDGFNGLIADPTPEALGAAMDRLWTDRHKTVEMGKNAHQTPAAFHITWDHVVESLTA